MSVIDIHYRSSNLTVKLLCEPPKWSPTDICVSLQHVNISVRVPKFVLCKSVSHQWQQKSVKGLKFPINFKSTMRNKWTSLYKQKTLLDQFFTTSEVGFCWHPNHHRPNKQCTKYTAWEPEWRFTTIRLFTTSFLRPSYHVKCSHCTDSDSDSHSRYRYPSLKWVQQPF